MSSDEAVTPERAWHSLQARERCERATPPREPSSRGHALARGQGCEIMPELRTFSCSSLELLKGFTQKLDSSMTTVWWA